MAQPLYPNPLPPKHPVAIQDCGIEHLVYQPFYSKIIPALQACILARIAVE